MPVEFDPGPPAAIAEHFAKLPSYAAWKDYFWLDWGPVFYRGRLDGSQRVLCVASDPGPTERIAGRTLVGDAGQRAQGFLRKIGLTRSYLCLNAHMIALFPGEGSKGLEILDNATQKTWRNKLYDMARPPGLEAIIAFGEQAQKAVSLWPGKGSVPVINVQHPSARKEAPLLAGWKAAVTQLRTIVTPDADGSLNAQNYGATFKKSDFSAIPRRDLPFGAPDFLGDDAWLRAKTPPENTSVNRPSGDRHTLIWKAPKS
ncbi:MAG TPA: hypothetical protein VGO52_21470 [Hyphomonadaceae bacterium]|jgi:uracil-DNA glycosylase|nr:hypothetical protein [Hyphomonadaceae bacterium]